MSFYTDVLQKHPLFHTTKAVNDLALLEPVTRGAVLALIADAKALGHELRVIETYRSCERQALLFQRGATRLRNVGVHHYGLAVDLGLYVFGKYVGAAEPYRFLVDLCAKHGLISGLDWGQPNKPHDFIDAGHVQRVAVKDQPRLFAGSFYPTDAYSPHATQVASSK
jgi:hypothetical protein